MSIENERLRWMICIKGIITTNLCSAQDDFRAILATYSCILSISVSPKLARPGDERQAN